MSMSISVVAVAATGPLASGMRIISAGIIIGGDGARGRIVTGIFVELDDVAVRVANEYRGHVLERETAADFDADFGKDHFGIGQRRHSQGYVSVAGEPLLDIHQDVLVLVFRAWPEQIEDDAGRVAHHDRMSMLEPGVGDQREAQRTVKRDRTGFVADTDADVIDFLEIDHIRNAPVAALPYGLQKRVELGRALAAEPTILLLDEPMAGMNLEEKEDMCRFVLDLNDEFGTTIVLIEHDMGVVMDISDRVVVLDYGRKIAQGNPDEVRANQAVIEAYLGRPLENAEDKT